MTLELDELKTKANFLVTGCDLDDEGHVSCPASTVPHFNFQETTPSDDEEDELLQKQSLEVRAKLAARKKWKSIFDSVCKERKDLPLRQMMLKKKHEDQIFAKM